MLIKITENDLHNIIKECLTEVVSKASYMKGYANNKGEHIPYSEIRYQQKYQTDDNNKKPRALSILVIKTIVDSYCKDVKIYRNNQDALLKIVRKLRNKVINGEGYKETIYNESTNGKTHILFDINNPHKPMYQFYIKYDSNLCVPLITEIFNASHKFKIVYISFLLLYPIDIIKTKLSLKNNPK